MSNPNKKRLRRTMMFLNAQKPGLIKDPYIYKPDSIMLDLGRQHRLSPRRTSSWSHQDLTAADEPIDQRKLRQ